MSFLPGRDNRLWNLCRAALGDDDTRMGVNHESAVVALQECAREQLILSPSHPYIDFFSQHVATTKAFSVRLVKRFLCSGRWGKLVWVPLDCL